MNQNCYRTKMQSKMIDSIFTMLSSTQEGNEINSDVSQNSSSSSTTTSDLDDPNLSPFLKHNIDAINLSDPDTQEVALRYLLTKVRDMENLLVNSFKSSKEVDDEMRKLYLQNDVLSAENLTLQESITALKDENKEFSKQVSDLRNFVNTEREKFISILSTNANHMREDIKILEEDIDYLSQLIPVTKELSNSINEVHADINRLNSEVARVDTEIQQVDIEIARIDTETDRISLEVANEIIRIEEDIAEEYEKIDKYIQILEKNIIRTETEVVVTNQYNRRENLIIDGIPDVVPQERLENVCVDLIRELGFVGRLGSYEIIGCHRLKKKASDVTTPVIIRFFNRKITEFCMKNRSKLRYTRSTWNLSFREDLCDANLTILEECEQLKKDGIFAKVYTHNGFVKVAKSFRDRPVRVNHINELKNFLPNV